MRKELSKMIVLRKSVWSQEPSSDLHVRLNQPYKWNLTPYIYPYFKELSTWITSLMLFNIHIFSFNTRVLAHTKVLLNQHNLFILDICESTVKSKLRCWNEAVERQIAVSIIALVNRMMESRLVIKKKMRGIIQKRIRVCKHNYNILIDWVRGNKELMI